MPEQRIYLYTNTEVLGVFDVTGEEIVAPSYALQLTATEEDALAFFGQQNVYVPDYFKSVELREQESLSENDSSIIDITEHTLL